MTLILLEGFDFTTSNGAQVQSQCNRLHNMNDVSDQLYSVEGRDGGKAMYLGVGLTTSWLWLDPPGHETSQTWIIGFNWKSRGTPGHA